jgi:hypothetical protein
VGGMLWPDLTWGAVAGALPWTVLSLAEVSIWLRQMREEHWEQLAEAYGDEWEALMMLWGRLARQRCPDVPAQRLPAGGFLLGGSDRNVRLTTGEPLRGAHGWGGAELGLARPGDPPHPPAPLLLTFARGWHPEWLAVHRQALHPSFVLIDDAFVAHTLDAVFGGGAAASPSARGAGG